MPSSPVTWWQAIILGLAQGLTEFIPVSSSAHLNILHRLFGQDRELAFDIILHIGTVLALAFYFRRDWAALLTDRKLQKLRNLVFLACVPAVIAGVLLRDLEEKLPLFKGVQFNALMLIVAGVVLWLADRMGRKQRAIESINLTDAVIVGCSQAMALIPGVSRSGATITAGLALGLTRESAARYSFLMSLPITTGAAGFELLKKIPEIRRAGAVEALGASVPVMLLGVLVAGASGFWAIGFLLNYLKTRDVTPFVAWRVCVALAVFIALALRIGF
jgi:undecaprenyl-diphosphatase